MYVLGMCLHSCVSVNAHIYVCIPVGILRLFLKEPCAIFTEINSPQNDSISGEKIIFLCWPICLEQFALKTLPL